MHLVVGSPPRGRGKVGSVSISFLLPWITPAWAGKSATSEKARATKQDHPRVGGEKKLLISRNGQPTGSPPRGRGKAFLFSVYSYIIGITPAWAGKSFFACSIFFFPEDHPRVGGEKEEFQCKDKTEGGSPPRGRGKDTYILRSYHLFRITPAWAGKRMLPHRLPVCLRDHPRVGGEKSVCRPAPYRERGSPPRGRGKASPTFLDSRV